MIARQPTFNPVRELTCLDHLAETRLGAEAGYWDTEPGIIRSISSIAEQFTYEIYNNAVKVLGETYSVAYLLWTLGVPYDTVCPKCRENAAKGDNGRFKVGWFLPMMPVHIHCKCKWKLQVKAEPKPPE